MRRILHATLGIIAAGPWLVAYFCGVLCAVFALAMDRVWPNADRGNCWSHALPMWVRRRGSVVVSFVEDARFARIFPVLHVAWIPRLPRQAEFSMTDPLERKKTQWLPWWAFYFRYRIRTVERRSVDRGQT